MSLSLTISRRFALLAVLSAIIAVGAVAFSLTRARDAMIEQKRSEIRFLVEAAVTMIEGQRLTSAAHEEAGLVKARLAEMLRSSRFDGGNYIYIFDTRGHMVMHPLLPKLEGQSALGVKDTTGRPIIQEMVDLAKSDRAGFIAYSWKKPGEELPSEKISYVHAVPEWDWVVAAGLHTSDIQSAFADLLNAVLIVLLPLLLGYMAVAAWLNLSVSRPLRALIQTMSQLATGHLDAEVKGGSRRDEVGAIARAVDLFRNGLQKRAEADQEKMRLETMNADEKNRSTQRVVDDVAAIVASAERGDFSARASTRVAEQGLNRLVEGINAINQSVEEATSEFAAAMGAISQGDLTHRINGVYSGRFAELQRAINMTTERLQEIVGAISSTSHAILLAAREINMGSDDLSKRTEEQASSLEETAATTEELAASVKASAQASRQAAAIAKEAMEAAQTGGAIAGRAVDAMARIEGASTKISDIIRVIDDIAFQTNLLALNAAVEAARAGDAGKGFAVVASEVRTLAQRSSEAAKDISALISSSNSEVGEGVKLVRQAGEQLSQILSASQKVAATIADISAASSEQASGIDEMSQAVAHLDEMTQQNAALAEQSAASAGSLSHRVGQLNDLVAAFKTRTDVATGQVTVPAASEPARLRQRAESDFAQNKGQIPRPADRPALPLSA
ncbi:MAG TPA: methyl-accepting chemotaxis protein [Bosea sp. (in: a-proteobacteria)]|uniref:methyl-accepting chemotaxis protein n=1 Tax=Bosea sp. (in: a-proteobacteria) TaxID=1871050 RepID=UPI002DDCB6C7|nr:methyl-accepting chemotaxis protein [Bosea sp. (in: a-proteobacteria)]HEV2553058.1 methyl-accepting chemotaxis protein [Bosea sp. (in: a-proteobacteria)]